ncbi:MAG: response regulator transcription factor, partial [Caldanaerobacter sp.]
MERLLIVDDEEMFVKGLKLSLEEEGFLVDAAYDGEEGLEKVREGNYDLVILDIMLPKIDGFTVCREIRRFSNIPIIMLTARGDDIDRIVGIEIGADDYLAKPFNTRELIARIKALL